MTAAIQQAQRVNHSPLTSMSRKYDNPMQPGEYEIQVFVRENGKAPFEQFVRGIRDKRARAHIYSRIDRLRLGLFGDCRGVGDGVHELKIGHGPGWRVYFVSAEAKRIVLLCGGTKRTQRADIARAHAYAKELKADANEEL